MARRRLRTATKTNTDIRNIPQALTVISEKQIEDQSIRSVADLLTFVPGAAGTGESNRDQFTLARQQHAPPTSSSTACATTPNISATSTTSSASRC